MDARMIRRMSLLPVLALGVALTVPAPAAAHAELTSTSPADGEELTTPPTQVVMTFGGELDPTGSGFVVTDAGGAEVGTGEVDLDVAERNVIRGPVDITRPGEYTVAWSSTAADGHPEEGSFRFSVTDANAAGNGDTPNTAVAARPGPHPLVLAGLALLAVAALAGARAVATARP
jgi:copper resistance protein C